MQCATQRLSLCDIRKYRFLAFYGTSDRQAAIFFCTRMIQIWSSFSLVDPCSIFFCFSVKPKFFTPTHVFLSSSSWLAVAKDWCMAPPCSASLPPVCCTSWKGHIHNCKRGVPGCISPETSWSRDSLDLSQCAAGMIVSHLFGGHLLFCVSGQLQVLSWTLFTGHKT